MRRRSVSDSRCEVERERERERDREKERIRREWMIRQQKMKEHEELKRRKIEEYERKRAEKLEKERRERERQQCRSRSESRSPGRSGSRHRSHTKKHHNNGSIMSERVDKSEGNKPFFKGSEDFKKYNDEELKKVTVQIRRNIPPTSTETNEVRRDVINPEQIVLKRREGEGSRPIFDREELKIPEPMEVEERRIVTTRDESLVKRSHSRRRSKSLSPRRHRSPSPRHHSNSRSHHSRSDAHYDKHHSEDRYRNDCKSKERASSREPRRHESSRRRSNSREKEYHRSSRSDRSERARSSERPYDRREKRDYSRERPYHTGYVEPVPVPVYFEPYHPRPMPMPIIPGKGPMMRPLLPPGMHPPMPYPPYPPRFVGPQDMYRMRPPNPRYPRM